MVFTPEEEAQILAMGKSNTPYVDPPAAPVPAAPAPTSTFSPGSAADLVATGIAPGSSVLMRGLRYPAVARAVLGPLGTVAGPALSDAATPSATGDMKNLSANAQRILSHDDKPGPLKEMNTPLANVQAAPQLTMPQVGRGAGGFGGGNNGIADARAKFEAAQQGQVDLIGKEADLQSEKGVAQADRIDAVSDKETEQANKQIEMAKQQEAIQADAHQYASDFMKETMRQNEELGKAQVDRRRLFKNMGAGDAAMFGIAAALGGMMQGLQGGSNKFLDYVERRVQGDVDDQMKEIENKRSALSARQNMFGQLLQQSGSRDVAAMQLMNLQLEAMKQQTKAFADKAGIPEALKASDQARNMIEQKQKQLQTGIYQARYQQKVAEASAAAAARAAAEEKAHQRQVELIKLNQEQQKIDTEKYKAGMTGEQPEGLPAGLTQEQRGKIIAERHQVNAENKEFNEQVDRLMKHPAVAEGTATAWVLGTLPGAQRIAPGSAKTLQDINEINTQMIQQIGKVAKDADGKPNKTMMDLLEKRFEIHPSDTPEIKKEKLIGVRNAVNALARQQGANEAPIPDQFGSASMPSSVQVKPKVDNPWTRK